MQQKTEISDEISEIIQKLPELWEDYRSVKGIPQGHPFSKAIAAISNELKIGSKDWWNDAITWLDANHPNWRGYEAPEVREVA
jgi:hypothetical protein